MQAQSESGQSEFFRAIVDGVPEAIVVASPDGRIVSFNHAAERLFGYAAAEVIGADITVLVPPQPGRRADPLKWMARWAAEPQTEQSRFLDFQARRRDGSEMSVDVRVSAGDIAGQPRFFITVRDNTARRQEQMMLKDANLRAARILLMAEDAIVSCDDTQTITFFNLAAERMFGYRMEEAMGQPLAMLLPEGERTGHAAMVEGFGADVSPSRMMSERRPVRGLRQSGETFPIEAAITKVSVGGELTYTAHLRDVSARHAEQSRLLESERRFRAMFDHAAGALALLDPKGVVLEINQSARALTEGADSLVGRRLWELPWLGAGSAMPDDPGRQRLKDALAAAAAGATIRYEAQVGEGEDVRRIDLTLTPIRDAAGHVIYILPEGRELAPLPD
jgi:PAS domain S-box-containing protein